MQQQGHKRHDRIESLLAHIDSYEPRLFTGQAELLRSFARITSRTIDSRYLERHPIQELLPDLEHLLDQSIQRPNGKPLVRIVQKQDATGNRLVLLTCMTDQRFIYSIVRIALESLQIRTYRTINTVVPVGRTASGEMASIGGPNDVAESFIWVELDQDVPAPTQQQLLIMLHERLEAAAVVVDDFAYIHQQVVAQAEHFTSLAERLPQVGQRYSNVARMLRWLLNENFVFLGLRYSNPQAGQKDVGTGTYRDHLGIPTMAASTKRSDNAQLEQLFTIRKSPNEAWIYRSGRCDTIVLHCLDNQAAPQGQLTIEGIFSYQALAQPRTTIPGLDTIIDDLYNRFKAIKGSHRHRTIRNAFNSLPLEYLFTLSFQDISQLVEQILDVDLEHRSQVLLSTDPEQAIAFVFVALPRTHFSDELRNDIRKLLKQRFAASSVDDGMYAGHIESVTLHYFLTGAALLDEQQYRVLEQDIDQLASPWSDKLLDALLTQYDKHTARRLHSLYAEAFANRYREETSIARAVEDIAILEQINSQNPFDCDLYQEKADQRLGITRLRLYQSQPLLLSEILPVLDNFGLIVIDQFPTTVHVHGRGEFVIATFRLSGVQGSTITLNSRRNRLCHAIRAVVLGAMGNEPLNRLLLQADIPWPSVVLIQAYHIYGRQIGMPFAQPTVQEALLQHALMVRSLTNFFRAKFDPEIDGQLVPAQDNKRMELIDRQRKVVLQQLDNIDDLTSDQVLRTIFNLIEATVRTNFFHRDPQLHASLVIKFDPSLITRMPDPRPYREIFVHHPKVLGLHLRGGAVARGGIRWSDRLLDFRTEVLGLMATQNLKNVIIVPRGAKGAFVLRHPAIDMSERRQQADAMYEIFITGLLEVTDNLVDGIPVPPKDMVCHEGSDHYLVVAADKGTAHLSDTANKIAEKQQFWLQDAFASGGSKGYDHKKEAITSRGAWACVRRHFREIDINPEQDTIRVVGIGDMSGDVFGNGMLRSQSLQLIAAFDHRHILIDPNPDPSRSFQARKQLFQIPRSSWEQYDQQALSPGAGIYPRSSKRISLSKEAQQSLRIATEILSGEELVRAILAAPVDLLWNGGIGTYIRASTENDLEVGDPANDTVRIAATEVQAKVIGEGGNLGITAMGRVELASRGIRLNTDAVDNSAGVDLSDHEVNLKILFQAAIGNQSLRMEERDTLMEALRDEVGQKVVGNNWLQSRMLSLDMLRSQRDMSRFQRAFTFLMERVPFRRRDSLFPNDRDVRARIARNEGLLRPELAFLAANAKLDLRQQLSDAAVDFPLQVLRDRLFGYFPKSLHQRFATAIEQHPLAMNIARAMLTNALITDGGATFLPELTLMTGKSTTAIIYAYLEASALIGADMLKAAIDTHQMELGSAVEYGLRIKMEDALEQITLWLLRRNQKMAPSFTQTFAKTVQVWLKLAPKESHEHTVLLAQIMPESNHNLFALFPLIDEVLDVAALAEQHDDQVEDAINALLQINSRCGLQTLLRGPLVHSGSDDLERPAIFILKEQLRAYRMALATLLMQHPAQSTVHVSLLQMMDGLGKDIQKLASQSKLVQLILSNERLRKVPEITDILHKLSIQ